MWDQVKVERWELLAAVKYGIEKCHAFLRAQTPKDALSALWACSQLVELLPDKLLEEVVIEAIHSKDFKVRIEVCYLMRRWGKSEGLEMLSALKSDEHPEVRAAFNQSLKDIKEGTIEKTNPLKELRAEIHLTAKQNYHRIRQFVLRFAVASGVLFVLCAIFVIIGSVCKWPFELIFSVCYVLGAFGIEVTLATLILHWKQKVVTKNGN